MCFLGMQVHSLQTAMINFYVAGPINPVVVLPEVIASLFCIAQVGQHVNI